MLCFRFLIRFGAAGRIRTCEPLRERISHQGRSGQSVDLESFTFDLAWLPQPNAAKMSVFYLINHFHPMPRVR